MARARACVCVCVCVSHTPSLARSLARSLALSVCMERKIMFLFLFGLQTMVRVTSRAGPLQNNGKSSGSHDEIIV